MIAGEKDWHAVAKAMGVKHVMLVDPQGRVHMDPATARRIKFEITPAPPVVLSDPL
jgi:thiamine biosynthesis lipoprotein